MTDIVHLDEPQGRGPLWGTATADLNATLLAWPPGHEVAEHVNAERDVLLVVLAGDGAIELDGETVALGAHDALVVPAGSRRRIVAGDDGIRYLTAHLRREGLQVATRAGAARGAP
jgi:mannose-6-phosphate isomerase-like protein (cupin superfamily)